MQDAEPEYEQLDLDPTKEPDFLVAIAGWPTLYSVIGADYAIPATGDLAQFSSVRAWASAPKGPSSRVKERPEDGGVTIGALDIEILDVNETGVRALSDLLSRQAYVEGTSSGTITTLATAINATETTVVLGSGTGLEEGDVVHISQEAILLGSKVSATFTGCTRGYQLSSPVAHEADVKVYGFKPAVFRSKAFVYKGYRGLTLDKWIPAGGSVIVGERKAAGMVSLSLRATTWETYANKRKTIANLKFGGTEVVGFHPPSTDGALLEADFNVTLKADSAILPVPTGLGDGHHVMNFAGHWLAIRNVSSETEAAGETTVSLDVGRGLSNTSLPSAGIPASPVTFGWTNVDFTSVPTVGQDPIEFLLQLLLSKKGDGVNHATYDVLKEGIGLGIPADQVDIASFEAVQAEYDYDDNARVFFVFDQPVEAKEFIEKELCRPFGWYLFTRNDGRIALVRPKHPQKFHSSRGNNAFTFHAPFDSAVLTATVSSGVRTGTEMASALQTAMNAVSSGFVVSWSNATRTFTITRTGGTWQTNSPGANSWESIGFGVSTGTVGDGVPHEGDEVGAFVEDDFNVLSENEMWDVQPVDNRAHQVTQVWFSGNYDWAAGEHGGMKTYSDAEAVNIHGLEDAPYWLKSKGLLVNNQGGGVRLVTPFSFWKAPASGCDPETEDVSSSYGLDATNSWASLRAAMAFDRYLFPPDRFKCRIPWRFNRKELGDELKITYSIDGVFVDRERNETTITARIYEIADLKPDYRHGHLEAELVGHRFVPY